jgi:hypothetical protein
MFYDLIIPKISPIIHTNTKSGDYAITIVYYELYDDVFLENGSKYYLPLYEGFDYDTLKDIYEKRVANIEDPYYYKDIVGNSPILMGKLEIVYFAKYYEYPNSKDLPESQVRKFVKDILKDKYNPNDLAEVLDLKIEGRNMSDSSEYIL